MERGNAPDYCVIGSVTCDLLSDEGQRAGGTVTFAALAAARLGYQVGAVTSAGLRHRAAMALEPVTEAKGVNVVTRRSQATTTFENVYQGNARQQVIRSMADPIAATDVPDAWYAATVFHLGPIAHEIGGADAVRMLERATGLRGLTPQGWLRQWDAAGRVTPGPWDCMDEMLALADAVILSPEDVGDRREALDRIIERGKLVVVTRADKGANVYQSGSERRYPAFLADVVDPTGAGDLFAVTFLLMLAETGDVAEAARYANCAAAFVIEGPGASNLPTREQLDERVRHGKMCA